LPFVRCGNLHLPAGSFALAVLVRRHFQVVPFQCNATVVGLALNSRPFRPTAQALRAEAAATPKSSAPPARLGLRTSFHLVPFQRSITVFGPGWLGLLVQPTAQAFRADVTATPARLPPAAGFGLGTRFQAVPFQRRIKVSGFSLKQRVQPTAQALRAEVTATPYRTLSPVAGFGLGTSRHRVPFHRSIRVFRDGPLQAQPTAHALRAEVTATAPSQLPGVAAFGLGTRFQAVPFQRRIRVLGL
jgi:hypothetical protein